MRDVMFIGYEHRLDLSESEHDHIMSEVWDLVQLNPEGRRIIPSSSLLEYTDYYEPMPKDYHTKGANYNEFKVTGKRQYKIGLKAAHVLGRPAYFSHLPNGQAYLVICNFFNNPSSVYSEEPTNLVGTKGHSFHIYNDDGRFGGFAELECNGQTIGGSTGKSVSSDQLVFWIYIGEDEKVRRIAHHLLGVSLDQLGVTTEYVRDQLVRNLIDLPLDKFLIQPCGVNTTEFHLDNTGKILDKYNLPPEYVICPGALTESKGPQNIVEASKYYSDLAATIFIGDGEIRQALGKAVRSLLLSRETRSSMAIKCRERATEHYSTDVLGPKLTYWILGVLSAYLEIKN